MAESNVSQALVWSNDNLFARPEPAYTFAKSVLDSDTDNKMYYKSICLRDDITLVETFKGVTICWHDVSQRDVDLVQFNGLFAVVDHLAERVEFVLAYDLEFRFGTMCATNIRQWMSPRISSITGLPEQSPESVSKFVMIERLLSRYPIVASAEATANRFWWWRFDAAVRRGYSVYESDLGDSPVVLSKQDLRDRGWTQPQGREFPGLQRIAIIAKAGTW